MNRAVVALLAGLLMALAGPIASQAQQSSAALGTAAPVLAGKKLFLQRCSVCHLPPLNRPSDRESFGPQLNRYIRGTETEMRAREVIAKGTARMPGFQYALAPKEIDDLIAYLKTL